MKKMVLCSAALAALCASPLHSQPSLASLAAPGMLQASTAIATKSAGALPGFEVATIKPSNPDTPGKQFMAKGRQFITINTTLNDMITFAYGLQTRQVTGGPAWMASEKYDLDGKADGPDQPTDLQWKDMIKKLLADRFKLTYHHEMKELPVFVLTVAKGGPKLTKSEADPSGLPGIGFRGFGNMPVSNASMADFAAMMQGMVLDRPMLDRTGLTDRFDFVLKWTPDDSQFASLRPPGGKLPGNDGPNAPPDLLTAVQEELGLKLESTKAPVEVMVIDRVERPSAN
jgi:uncharacterized protein (TIGR03435 family)